jgi:outer membrane protein assembly complex protein YaeT
MKGTDKASAAVGWAGWCKALLVLGLLAAVLPLARPGLAQSPAEPLFVSDVVIHGTRTISPEQVKAHLKTRAGREYSASVLEEDLRRLAETRWFKNYRVHEQNSPQGVVVHFHLEEHPSVVREVLYRNAHHVRPEVLDKITGIRRGMPLNPAQNRRACFEIQEHYRREGRLLASVELVEGGDPADTRVVFNITEGPVVRIRNIRFTGNSTLASSARLRTQIDSGRALFGMLGGKYQPVLVDNDALKLEQYYKDNGYLDARVTRELIVNDDLRTVDVVFHIHEGMRYKVQDVSLEGPKKLNRDLVQSVLRVRKGDTYNEHRVDADVRNITDLYGYRGYGVLAEKRLYFGDKEPGVVRVHYEVQERGPDIVGEIHIEGNTVTKDRVIRRVLQLEPGQTLQYPLVRAGERDLAKLQIFEVNPEKGIRPTITVLEPPDPDNPVKDIRVQVQETYTGSIMIGAGINSDQGLVGSLVFNERNFDILRPLSLADIFEGRAFRGGGQEFRAELVPGTEVQRYTVSFREPYLFDRPISLSVGGYYYDRIYLEDTESRLGTRITLGYQLNRLWTVTGGIRVEDVGIRDVPFFAPPDYLNAQGHSLVVGPRVSLIRDDRDSFLRPTEGSLLEASFEQVFGSYTFPIFNVEGSQYFTVRQRPDGSGRHVLALRSQFSWAGDDAPVFERFYGGGFRSIRGFEFRGVGPFVNGFNVGGDFLWTNSVEYQLPILANDQIYLVGFLDSGTVESRLRINDYRVSAGFGARIVVPMLGPVPIALDFGFPIVRGPQDREQIFSFYVGLFR